MDGKAKENQIPQNISVKKFASFEEEAQHYRESIVDIISTLTNREETINELMLKLDLVGKEKDNSARVLEDQIIIKNKTIYDQGDEIKKLKEQMQIMKASENNNDDLLREYTEANVILSGKNKELEIEIRRVHDSYKDRIHKLESVNADFQRRLNKYEPLKKVNMMGNDTVLKGRSERMIEKLQEDNEKLKEQNKKAIYLLVDMVNQSCQYGYDTVSHMCISAYEDAFEFLENINILKDAGNGKYKINWDEARKYVQ